MFTGENTEEEGALICGFNSLKLDVGHDDVVHWLVLVGREQMQSHGNLSLLEALQSFRGLQNNVVAVDFPKPLAFRANAHNEEVYRNVGLAAEGAIFLHQGDDNLSLFGDSQTVLRIVEPALIRVEMNLGIL